MDQAGVLPDPTQAGALGQVAFEDGPGIGVSPLVDLPANLFFDESHQGLQPGRDDVMVIAAPGIRGNPAFAGNGRLRRWDGIRNRDGQERVGFREDLARVGAALQGPFPGQVAHGGMPPGFQPAGKYGEMRRRVWQGNPHEWKAEAHGLGFDDFGEGCRPDQIRPSPYGVEATVADGTWVAGALVSVGGAVVAVGALPTLIWMYTG